MAIVTGACLFLFVWSGVLIDGKKAEHASIAGWHATVHVEPSPGFIVE